MIGKARMWGVAMLALAGLALAGPALAQYPDKPVKVVVPYAPGGTSDFAARLTATKLAEATGKSFIVENKTGAGGRVGYETGARAEPDGYTLVASDTSYAMMAGLYSNLRWDHANDLVPVTVTAETPVVLVVSKKSGFTALGDLIAFAKANPGKLNYGSGGPGSSTHLAGELFNKVAGVKIQHVPFRGAGDAVNAVLSGTVEVLIAAPPTVVGHVKAGSMAALAVSSDRRTDALPEVPTSAEAGLPAFRVSNWFGLMAPRGTPAPVLAWVRDQVAKALASDDVKARLAAQGAVGVGSTPAEALRTMRDDTVLWTDTIKAAGITLE
jgi:tripartite-type tricarboxylate transporter receptor subunit TctC